MEDFGSHDYCLFDFGMIVCFLSYGMYAYWTPYDDESTWEPRENVKRTSAYTEWLEESGQADNGDGDDDDE